jgi:hypothetical protein
MYSAATRHMKSQGQNHYRNKRTASVNGNSEHSDQLLIRVPDPVPALGSLEVDGLIEEVDGLIEESVAAVPVEELVLGRDTVLELEGPEVVTLLNKIPAGVTVSEVEPFEFEYAPRSS